MAQAVEEQEIDYDNLELADVDYAEAIGHLIAYARTDFWTYMQLFSPPEASPIVWGKLHEFLAQKVQAVADRTAKGRQIVSVPPQHGKFCSDSTPVLTTVGWKRHGNLQIGDNVFAPNGKPVRVCALIPQTELASMEVTLSNNQKIKVHPRHEWTVLRGRRVWKTLETQEMLQQGLWSKPPGKRGSRARFQLPFCKSLNLPPSNLSIPPYYLGAWLGDGDSDTTRICGIDGGVFDEIEKHYSYTTRTFHDKTFVEYRTYAGQGIVEGLRDLWVFRNKHIPYQYLLSSHEQRLELLAGLIDTDGSLSSATGQYRFINSNKRLIDGFCRLLSTFGWTYSVTSAEPCTSSSGCEGSEMVWYVGFTPTEKIPCRVPRKQSDKFVKRRMLSIIDIRELPLEEQEPGMCIQVDSPDGLYLVGETLVPTHNSTVLSKEAASWVLGRFPGIQIAITGYSNDLVTDFSKAVRDRVNTPLYRQIFPDAVIAEGENTQDTWKMTNGSALRARSTGSKLTGRRVDWLIIDDPHAGREEAESPNLRKKVIDWYYADCYTRLSPNAIVFIISTRWHPEDLIGKLTDDEKVADLIASGHEKEVFEITNLPAIAHENDPLGRAEGEALFPEVRDLEFLLAVKRNIPSYEWSSQYDCRPKSGASDQVNVENLIMIEETDVPKTIPIVRSWDLALTEKQTSDYTAGALTGYDGMQDHFYIIDMFRNRKQWVQNRKNILFIQQKDLEKWNVLRMGIEAVAGFLAVFQDLYAALLGACRVEARTPPRGGKLTRALPWLNKIEAKRVFVVKGAWVKEFKAELEGFPDGNHDDQIDAVSTGWEMHTGANRNGTIGGKPIVGVQRPTGENRPDASVRPDVVGRA